MVKKALIEEIWIITVSGHTIFNQRVQESLDQEIFMSLLTALRLAEHSLCESPAKHLTDTLDKAIRHYKLTLTAANEKRSGIKTLEEFAERLLRKYTLAKNYAGYQHNNCG